MGKIKDYDFWKKIRQSLISTVIEKDRKIIHLYVTNQKNTNLKLVT